MGVSEQRTYPRVKPPKSVVVAWQSGIQREVSFVSDLAAGGLFLRTKRPVPIRSAVQILIEMPVGQVRGRAVVRRVEEKMGMAVQIIAMEPEDRGRLLRQIKDFPAA